MKEVYSEGREMGLKTLHTENSEESSLAAVFRITSGDPFFDVLYKEKACYAAHSQGFFFVDKAIEISNLDLIKDFANLIDFSELKN